MESVTLSGHDFGYYVDVDTARDVGPFPTLADAVEYAGIWSGTVVVTYIP